MKHATDATVPSPLRRMRGLLPVLLVAGVLAFSACATTPESTTPSPTASDATASPTTTPSSSPQPSETPSPSASSNAQATATPYNGEILIITSEVRDGSLQVSAMVPGVSESGGTCTLTLTSTGASVQTAANEGKDVTYCGLMSIAVAGGSGEPAFQVSYASSTTSAKSAVTTVEPTS
ncbi:hypothetical protein [Microbacterium testaceum]|uniref:hypothetical protein n=1 Tax=Microbacterium testaceum TaxID=2033 RepID=UPI0011411185|nr:hypothetical protein [Microbacterium testaceum]